MADKKDSQDVQERIYTIPLRCEWRKGPRIKRAGRAVGAVRKYLIRHAKAGEVKISGKLNEQIWTRGLKNPPISIRVKVYDKDGVMTAMLPDEELPKEEEKGRMEKLKDRFGGTKTGEKLASKLPEDVKAEEPAKEGEKLAEAEEGTKSEEPAKEQKSEIVSPDKETRDISSSKTKEEMKKTESKDEKPKEDKKPEKGKS